MINIVNFSIVSRVDVILIIESFLDFFQENFLELFVDFLVNIDVISCHTSLSAVDVLSKNNANGCAVEVGCFINNNWTFSP